MQSVCVAADLPASSSACKGGPSRVAQHLAEHHGEQRHRDAPGAGHSGSLRCSQAAASA